ncbi:MAG TPA: chemotaxis protein CheB [Candidatus Limnocylindria bacterium]|nr:chemotaxis protein CheB [Candidatus Limnocylindria bacterium]
MISGRAAVSVVGVGASAGGFEAFSQLLRALPARTGMAFVLVQHLDPTHESQLAALLSRTTRMPVIEIENRTRVLADHVYVIPPNTNLTIADGVLRLTPRAQEAGQHLPVDVFLTSLAVDRGPQAIGVILSGTASDGVLGLKAIKAENGLTFAQDDASAKYTGMPRNAVAAGCVDLVLPPEGIAAELARISRHPYVAPPPAATRAEPTTRDDEASFGEILALLQTATGADFREYKQTTVRRRIARRMVLHRIETVRQYLDHLERHPSEVEALRQDILINVTQFFRDPDAFAVLGRKVFPGLMKKRSPRDPVRIWVPGCATGEEAYSIAMCFLEFLGEGGTRPGLQIFATDVSAPAIERARAGNYPESISAEVSPGRLRRFFVKEDGHYQVSKALRALVVFATQDVAVDPPFSKLDLISCRNMLIYFSAELQQRIVPIFHYALKPDGYLLLGPAESIAGFAGWFAPLDKKHKIYAKRPGPARVAGAQAFAERVRGKGAAPAGPDRWVDRAVAVPGASLDLGRIADRLVVKKFGPAGVIVSSDMEILQFRGRTGPYLEAAPGAATFNLLKMIRQGLLGGLRAAVRKAKRRGVPARSTGIRLKQQGRTVVVDLEVVPLRTEGAGETFLVLFERADARAEASRPAASPGPRSRARGVSKGVAAEIAALKREIIASKEYMQSVIDERETSNEELRSATEEIQSSNEELQSTNEELETAKEELQSSNEELTTVNDELQARNAELAQVNGDLVNVLTSVNIPLVIVGRDLRIRRFSGAIDRLLDLVGTDVGRPLGEASLRMNVVDLERLVMEVTTTLVPQEREIQDRDGRWTTMRVRPYRTQDDHIDGAVISFTDIDALRRARDYAETIVETVRQPLLVLDAGLRVVTANRAFYATFQVTPGETIGRVIDALGSGQWNIPALRARLESIVPHGTGFEDLEIAHEFEGVGERVMRLNARRLESSSREEPFILLALEDVTARARADAELRRHGEELASASRAKDDFLAVLSHELRTPLTAMLGWARMLRSGTLTPERAAYALEVVDRNARLQAHLIEELLDVSRIVTGKLSIELRPADAMPVVHATVESLRPMAEAKGLRLTIEADDSTPAIVPLDVNRMQQALSNVVSNAIKYTPDAGTVQVRVQRSGSRVVIAVTDSGPGVSPDLIPHIFERFRQGDNVITRAHGGLGLGLAIARHLVELHLGTIAVENTQGGHGATFKVTLPLAADPEPTAPWAKLDLKAVEGAPLKGVRVLVVEDDPDTRELLEVVLGQYGAAVRAVGAVAQALVEFERLPPHVLVSDIAMPDQDGYSLIRRVRALSAERGGRTAAVALTAHARPDDRALALTAGYDEHVAKPIDPATLVDLVARLAAGKQDGAVSTARDMHPEV